MNTESSRVNPSAQRPPPEPIAPNVIGWAVLLLLLGLSVLAAYQPIGIFQPIVHFGIAFTQAAIVFILFMKLRGRPSLKGVFAGAGFFWLMFLFGLSTVDYATRSGFPLR
jgi:caa(3)-type oxidase subunit IV